MIIRTNSQLPGATFGKKAKSVFRPTAMSLAMARAGIIPGTHLVQELCAVAAVRNRNDQRNERLSVSVAF
jgi:hypothetical protein